MRQKSTARAQSQPPETAIREANLRQARRLHREDIITFQITLNLIRMVMLMINMFVIKIKALNLSAILNSSLTLATEEDTTFTTLQSIINAPTSTHRCQLIYYQLGQFIIFNHGSLMIFKSL